MLNSSEFEYQNINEINKLDIGDLLKKNREILGLSIIDVANIIKVKEKDIFKLENNNIEEIEKNIYIIGLIKSYGKLLKINNKIIEEKLDDLSIKLNIDIKKHTLLNLEENKEFKPSKNLLFKSYVLLFFILLFLILILFVNENNLNLINTNLIISDLIKIINAKDKLI
jgi:hypothetical protein